MSLNVQDAVIGISSFRKMEDGSAGWKFNGNMESPTFEPSLRNSFEGNNFQPRFCCHLNLTNGILFFHADCTHENRGKQMPMIEFESNSEENK